MKVLISFLLLILSTSLRAQESIPKDYNKDIRYIQSFIADLADENKAIDIILSQYLIVENPSDEIYDYLEVSLQEVRINLMAKNLKEIEYIPYNKMPKKEIRDIDPEDLDTDNMYFLQYRKRQMLAVYLENDKVGSLTLVSKGNNLAHFVLY
ncbi:hypothetical protein [Sphingobacterium paucimobilis]|uniref:DUF4252 domain-containing protein n=1 Tax=Sphingobacterium paucimobilis HER1398 TaxID=1346330 RepID=U2HG19_9SPHI|nr:hypothetical protein [Sphingobacterium paucimobilis]ERJ60701.1 hypothetical protein M472_18240 [Sphingobacterium paucimobilis HER1398]